MFTAVSDEIGRLTKALAALATLVGLLSCVHEHVFLHVGFLVESFAAIITRERSDVGVDEHVRGQGRGTLEMFTTSLALKYLNSGVRLPVLRQADVMTECLTAGDAAVWAATRVRAPHVYLQTVWCAKYFLAGVACERLARVALLQLVFTLRFHGLFEMYIFLVESYFHVFCRRSSF